MCKMEWWLISDEDVKEIRELLNQVNCNKKARIALHTLNTGLHKTDCVPSDFSTASYVPSDDNRMLVIKRGNSITRFIWSAVSERWEPFGEKWITSKSDKYCPDCKKQLGSPTELEYRKLYEGDFKSIDELAKIGSKSTCKNCGELINYTGKYWQHINSNPRHPANPVDFKRINSTNNQWRFFKVSNA